MEVHLWRVEIKERRRWVVFGHNGTSYASVTGLVSWTKWDAICSLCKTLRVNYPGGVSKVTRYQGVSRMAEVALHIVDLHAGKVEA